MVKLSSSSIHAFDEVSDIITPRALHQFLAAREWALYSEKARLETWVHGAPGARDFELVHIPRDHESGDFARRMREAGVGVAETYGWTLSELAEQVASIRADLFYVRVKSPASDGTIPLHQASATIDSIERMIKSAATVTHSPNASGRGRAARRVTDFMSDDVRMGHTRRGSFVITIAARLEDPRSKSTPESLTVQPGQMHIASGLETPHGEPIDFTRRVMTTLSRSLDATSRYLRAEDDFVEFDAVEEAGTTPRMIESLQQIAESALSSSVDLEFEWAPVVAPPANVVDHVRFGHKQLDAMPQIIERLRRTSEHPEHMRIVGPVTMLSRGDEPTNEPESGEVQILAEIGGVVRKVMVPLAGSDYNWAIFAHQHKRPLSLEGTLARVAGRWRIIDNIELDATMLQIFQEGRVAQGVERATEALSGPASKLALPQDLPSSEVDTSHD